MTAPLRVLLVDDDPFTLTMMSSMLRTIGCEVVGEATSAAQGLSEGHLHSPDVAVLDLDLGEGPTGIDLAHRLRAVIPSLGIVVLSTYEEPRLMGYNQPPLPAGSIYLVKRTVVDTAVLERALQMAVDPDLREGLANPESTTHAASSLSDLQIDLMRMVAAGYSNAEIARRRSLTVASVEKAIARLIKQLGLHASPAQNQRVMIAQVYYQITGAVSARLT
ncbi:MAG: response regulator transcription factor [Actinobacteria bacterium]|nr:response regulator transcription factor [Actinomycetota bacterium]